MQRRQPPNTVNKSRVQFNARPGRSLLQKTQSSKQAIVSKQGTLANRHIVGRDKARNRGAPGPFYPPVKYNQDHDMLEGDLAWGIPRDAGTGLIPTPVFADFGGIEKSDYDSCRFLGVSMLNVEFKGELAPNPPAVTFAGAGVIDIVNSTETTVFLNDRIYAKKPSWSDADEQFRNVDCRGLIFRETDEMTAAKRKRNLLNKGFVNPAERLRILDKYARLLAALTDLTAANLAARQRIITENTLTAEETNDIKGLINCGGLTNEELELLRQMDEAQFIGHAQMSAAPGFMFPVFLHG